MGHKVHPTVFRLGNIYTWPSHWFARRNNYARLLKQDVEIREFLREELKEAGFAKVEIERGVNALTLTIHAAKPGFIIGRGGSGVEELKKNLKKKFLKKEILNLNIQEVEKPSLSAPVVLQTMIADLEKRIPFRRVLKQSLERLGKAGAQGGRVWAAGRLNGAEIARTEVLAFGKLPLHNLRADIDYAFGEAHTIYGKLGVKIWIYKGEIFKDALKDYGQEAKQGQPAK
ncbi:MAG: 30S ribosomal protein S3 [bacterium]|nr:30S ribosomal protein S3 [bacterium]